MDNERFNFLTHEQFTRLSQKEKVAYLERATVELEGCGRLTLAHLCNLSPMHARSDDDRAGVRAGMTLNARRGASI
jgi:hypothetical protein